MSVDVQVWNVGHGDAIRIDFDNNFRVVRDFGRSQSSMNHSGNEVDIGFLLTSNFVQFTGNADAVLSHAHEDHFNGFLGMQQQGNQGFFNTSYLPWLDFQTINSLGFSMTRLGSYIYGYYGPTSPQGRSVKHWMKAAPVMSYLSRYFCGVSAGHRFDSLAAPVGWPMPALALWPPPPTDPEVQEDILADDTNNAIEAIERSIIESNPEWPKETFLKMVEQIARLLRKYYETGPSEPVSTETFDPLKDIDQIESILGDISNIEFPMNRITSSTHQNGWHTLYSDIDDHSLVFDIEDRALFLSDINDKPMDKMADNYMSIDSSYELIKSSHHGTRMGTREFQNSISWVRDIVHNCGTTWFRNWRGPTANYCHLAPANIYYTDFHLNADPLPYGYTMNIFGKDHHTFSL